MANDEDVARLRQGVDAWNNWRAHNPERRVDLSGADFFRANLIGADLRMADFSRADLTGARLGGSNLTGADLLEARLMAADLIGADLTGARLNGAHLSGADLSGSNLTGAKLTAADLTGADLICTALTRTNFAKAVLTGCRVYGISAWDLKLEGAVQRNLVITDTVSGQPEVTVDNLEVAQFIYLLLHNEKIRDVIDTIGRKGVLLLGRFTEGRLAVLERLRAELRSRDFVPMVFNFDKPETKDFTGTVRLLAGLSRFVIVDITNPRSAPLELQATVPEYMIPFVPIIEDGEEPFAMFQDLWVKHREWVLDPIAYGSVEELVQGMDQEIIQPALVRFDELVVKKAEKLRVRRIGTR
jgi:hypothetical protein